MKNLLLLILLLPLAALAQTRISGRITDTKKQPLPGVNVYVKDAYDGASTDTDGRCNFTTSEEGKVTIIANFIGYKSAQKEVTLTGEALEVLFELREDVSMLNAVVITAGAFEASDEKRGVLLRPLDIVTTAGAEGDIFQAIQTLPGTQRVGEEEGLFVRGGAASETQTFIDGMLVENPFFSNTPDVPQRGRFSPFLFKGTTFSTGGFSAQYGQALSSALTLQTHDLPDSSQSAFGINAAGVSASHTHRFAQTSLAVDASYTNLGGLFKVVPQNVNWLKAPEGLGGSLSFRHKPNPTGIFKIYSTYSAYGSGIRFRDFEQIDRWEDFRLQNQNLNINSSYQQAFGKWIGFAGVSYSHNRDAINLSANTMGREDQRIQGRFTVQRNLNERISLLAGAEVHHYQAANSFNQWEYTLTDVYSAAFAEAEVYISPKLAGRVGVRGEHSRVLGQTKVSSRTSLAYKTGEFSQVSVAQGTFRQAPRNEYLFTNENLGFERAEHYILNYQLIRNLRTFRIEGYYKQYNQLVKEEGQVPFNPNRYRQPTGNTNNEGVGYARGFDIFWRDQKTLKGIDYWVSYSFLDTKRLYANFPIMAPPVFASRHNLNVVYKQFFRTLRSSVAATYTLSSGRPYYNPEAATFHSDRTPPFSSLGINVSHLTHIRGNFTVLYASVSNVLGTRNVFGYRYSEDGQERMAVQQAANRGFFIGALISINHK
jgi:hypothetical protein